MDLAKRIGAIAYFECSAKANKGIEEIFEQISKYALKEHFKNTKGRFSQFLDVFNCCSKN
ncbi:RAS-like GTP-binding protein [Nosema bombycis CQ1]|uniref:RAS-like GTP-binding protein n=1 Tax=Nosema bombycis (strain CQ1 / CVCC 102059) TaxID=578461 RepID=R0MBV2_NOSB1|nr:RAS-like GTP-binding protein [Nosema bombycis CQ1]|eukprot:EOB11520.1 RAS-like GTP-binding protein [Nosema bombycis CQ1]